MRRRGVYVGGIVVCEMVEWKDVVKDVWGSVDIVFVECDVEEVCGGGGGSGEGREGGLGD